MSLPVKRTPKKSAEKPQPSKSSLEEYRKKRDPVRTTEPFGAERKHSPVTTLAGRFVVHLHDARRRHFDLRVQVGRTLKSFAVPRGPSLDPKERRLAVLTEDHPLEYVDFENVIPEGSYGAGAMIVWDVGRISYLEASAEDGIQNGKLDFILQGHKLKGRFALVRTKRGEGNEWLLLKKQDAHAREAGEVHAEAPWSVLSGLTVEELAQRRELAQRVAEQALELGAARQDLDVSAREPMLCAQNGVRLDDPERLYELKLDGVRIVADKRGDVVTLRYRNGGNCSASYPEIVRAVETLPGERLVLDGEIVAFDEQGRPSFERLLPRVQARRPRDAAFAAEKCPIVYLVFDLLALEQAELTRVPLHVRKRLLTSIVRGRGLVRVLDHLEGRGAELFELCCSQGLEGIVAKKRAALYQFGPRRTDDWVKHKCQREDDFVVVGWVSGKGARSQLGALCLGSYRGDTLVYRGRVGSGFDAHKLSDLYRELAAREHSEPTLPAPLPDETRHAHWVRPELVARVRYLDFTDDGRLRQPVFVELDPHKPPTACTAAPHEAEQLELVLSRDFNASDRVDPNAASLHPGLSITNRDKVFWPGEGYTKGDLLDYYAAVAPAMLPFLERRPVVLVRHPDGIEGKSFFQWNIPPGTPDFIRNLTLKDPDEPSHDKTVFLVNDLTSLLYIVNLGCIPLHVLACREGSLESCDFLTVDLDLGEQPFARAVEIAMTLREILNEAGLRGFPKTSGQGGLHLLVPLGPGVPFDAAKLLVELLGRLATARHPEFATMERRVARRGGRLYVDTGQTGASRTIVAPYSVRAVPGATVSTPLHWDELSGALDPRRFTILSVPERLRELGDPLEDLFSTQPDIGTALVNLERLLKAR